VNIDAHDRRQVLQSVRQKDRRYVGRRSRCPTPLPGLVPDIVIRTRCPLG
jgi:hypothetical protein